MWLQDIRHYLASSVPFWVILLCGLVGILVDIDHPIAYYLIPEWSRRFLHTPLLIGGCFVLCGCGAYIGGLLLRVVLKG